MHNTGPEGAAGHHVPGRWPSGASEGDMSHDALPEHPHDLAVRRFLGGAGEGTVMGAVQHHGRQKRHPSGRHGGAVLEIGQIASYDSTAGTALVQVPGAPTHLLGPLPVTACARTLSLVGLSCLVVLLDAHNPADGAIVAVW